MKHFSTSLLITITLSACVDSSLVQKQYISMRDDCRNRAEAQESQYTQNQQIDERDRSSVLASLFSDCMYEMGWTVATPPREGGGGGGGVIDTARQKPPAEQPQQGNVTLQPSPLPMSPTEQTQGAPQGTSTSTQFPNSNYQAIPTPAPIDKKTSQGGVATVTTKKATSTTPATMEVKPKPAAVAPSDNGSLSADEQKSILDNLSHPR